MVVFIFVSFRFIRGIWNIVFNVMKERKKKVGEGIVNFFLDFVLKDVIVISFFRICLESGF